MIRRILFGCCSALWLQACDNLPCTLQSDCPIGYFCSRQQGQCTFECLEATDCPAASRPTERAICTNEGRCALSGRPPRLIVREPAFGQRFAPGAETYRVSGRIETPADQIRVQIESKGQGACGGTVIEELSLSNPTPGFLSEVPFLIDDIALTPEPVDVEVKVSIGVAERVERIQIDATCESCPQVEIAQPLPRSAVVGLQLPRLQGRVEPRPSSPGFWRITDRSGQVFDGRLEFDGFGRYEQRALPLFAGVNTVQVRAPGSGDDGRCAISVITSEAVENGLRSVLTWNADSDLDTVLVAPGGSLARGEGLISPRFFDPDATVDDDFDGFGPEVLQAPVEPGTYGLAVEAITDGSGSGSTALLRVLVDGRLITVPPAGPRFLSAERGDVWLAGLVQVGESSAQFVPVDRIVSLLDLPDAPPEDWP